VLIEAGIGIWTGSMALLGDAGHNLSDVLGLMLAWGAASLSVRRPSARHTYGSARSTILAALLNAALLLVACGALAWESIGRIGAPQAVPGFWIGATAFVAFGVNALSPRRSGTRAARRERARRVPAPRGRRGGLARGGGRGRALIALTAGTGWTRRPGSRSRA
jgi:cation diffusion facilitator family transporter